MKGRKKPFVSVDGADSAITGGTAAQRDWGQPGTIRLADAVLGWSQPVPALQIPSRCPVSTVSLLRAVGATPTPHLTFSTLRTPQLTPQLQGLNEASQRSRPSRHWTCGSTLAPSPSFMRFARDEGITNLIKEGEGASGDPLVQ